MYLLSFLKSGTVYPLLLQCSDALCMFLYSLLLPALGVELVYNLGHWERGRGERAKKVNGHTEKQHMVGMESWIVCLRNES